MRDALFLLGLAVTALVRGHQPGTSESAARTPVSPGPDSHVWTFGASRPPVRSTVLAAFGAALARAMLDAFGGGSYLGAVMTLAARMFVARAQVTSRKAARKRRAELERELAGYATPAERCDLEAALDRYPDGVTHELRGILAGQSVAAQDTRFPAIGRH